MKSGSGRSPLALKRLACTFPRFVGGKSRIISDATDARVYDRTIDEESLKSKNSDSSAFCFVD